jgi:phage terminase small subunit
MGTYIAAGRTFNLSTRALAFAKIRAERPRLSVKACAVDAGYAEAGAAVRGFELLKDDRVIRAILHFAALALAKATGELSARMQQSCLIDDRRWRVFDRTAIDRLRAEGKALAERMAKIEKLYEALRALPEQKAAGRRPAGLARAKRVTHKDNRESMLREIRSSLDLLAALGVNLEDQRQSVPD